MQPFRWNVNRWFDRVSVLPACFYQLVYTISLVFGDSHFLLHTIGKTRRLWMVHFRKEYVQRQLIVRGGDCRQCGACCNLLFTCPMLTKQRRCHIYGYCRPLVCKVFPIDQRDIDEVTICGGHCGYRFDREDSDKVRDMGRS